MQIEYSINRIENLKQDSTELAVGLADLLIDCVAGGASVGYMHPLDRQKADRYWLTALQSVQNAGRVILVAVAKDSGSIIGTVSLMLDLPENQPHRADVSKMLVLRSARKQGLGAALMVAIQQEAASAGRTLLVLDTETGSPAQHLYAKLGWQRSGEIPNFALWPNGESCSTTYMYRQL